MSDIRVSPDAIHNASTRFANAPGAITSAYSTLSRAAHSGAAAMECVTPAPDFEAMWESWTKAFTRMRTQMQATAVLLALTATAYARTECINLDGWDRNAPPPSHHKGPVPIPANPDPPTPGDPNYHPPQPQARPGRP
jgi:hypothetical protein